ncbi:PP2C family protein-serine/threonine phosphatase [Bythopirellula goksoeyrii]|uniref:PP2C family protein-serine/threonine phosphatase n=1 Tax=Bythopirellula goksoeyrii TaxID=1400387 RepID=UPI001AEFF84E|nr:PP2C family protein-serine/threonine phosphatase [Bythopirellula goksoeyrii]
MFSRSIRTQLLFAVNLPLVVLVTVFLVYDYNRMMGERVIDMHLALEEEAKTLLPAITRLSKGGTHDVQQYIDSVCEQMQTEKSPGHHIAVQTPSETLQATSHGRESPEMLAALHRAGDSSTGRASISNQEFVVGTAKSNKFIVYVAERLSNVKHRVRQAAIRRLSGILIAFVSVALLVNILLLRAVTHPVQKLVATVQQIGRGLFDVKFDSFNNAEMDYLATEINTMSQSLASADRNRKMQMAKAREIQQNLLPKNISSVSLRIAQLFEPAEDIGGDFYDILSLHDGSWLICVADVTGHGIPAAMSAAMLKTVLLQAVETQVSPATLLDVVNRRFVAVSLMEDFVSMTLIRVEPSVGQFQYASAGHEPAWLASSEGVLQELTSTGLLVGIDEYATWEEVDFLASTGTRLLLVTDGLSETFNSQGEMFGRARIAQLFNESRKLTIEQTIQRIDEAVRDFRGIASQQDDVTVVLVEMS